MLRVRTVISLLLAFAVQCAGAQANDARAAVLPPLEGTSFAGSPVKFPDALRGRVNVLVIGFARDSQESAQAWGKALAAHYPADSGVMYYELPVVADVPSLLRNWVIGRIRHSISVAARPHFVPVIDDEAAWKQAAGAGPESDACVLVVDGQGSVRWHYQGASSAEKFAELERAVSGLQPGGGLTHPGKLPSGNN